MFWYSLNETCNYMIYISTSDTNKSLEQKWMENTVKTWIVNQTLKQQWYDSTEQNSSVIIKRNQN